MSAARKHQSNRNDAGVPPAPPEAHQRAEQSTEFQELLTEALTKPGVVNAAYSAFHRFSIGNQILAAVQLLSRGLPVAPIASFMAWKLKGRFVKKGQKAISLYRPVTLKRRNAEDGEETFTRFILRAQWFSLDQTEGAPFAEEIAIPRWDRELAMQVLEIQEVPFSHVNGNCMGSASKRSIQINPLNPLKHKTRFHELAHVVLGHTEQADIVDGQELSRSIEEVEAESVAYILCALLDLPGQAESRHYVQNWLAGHSLPERNSRRIFTAADKILRAGQLRAETGDDAEERS